MPIGDSAMRDHLANERTLLAWVRTALAFIAFGIALEKFSVMVELSGAEAAISEGQMLLNRWLAIALLLGAIGLSALGTIRTLNWEKNALPPQHKLRVSSLLLPPALTTIAAAALIVEILMN